MKTLTAAIAMASASIGILFSSIGSREASNTDQNDLTHRLQATDSVVQPESPPFKTIGHPSFMSPHAAPITVHDGFAFVVNTPADTVDLIDTTTRELVHRIPVGIDPVSLALRPDGKELWVSNHISDSVSVIDLDRDSHFYLQVIATIQEFDAKTKATRFDEPVGIAFASNEKAYVALSSENEIAVIDVSKRKITNRIKIRSQDPRQIIVRNNRLYVIPFESNNQTQLSGGNKDNIDGDLVTFDAWQHSVVHNNVLSIGHVVDIVKHPDVPDRDLFVFDTTTDKLIETVDTLGTLLYGMTVDSNGNVFIAQTDARNDINGRAGTKKQGLKELDNRAFLNRITHVAFADKVASRSNSNADVKFIDLEPLPPQHPDPNDAVATPFAIEVSCDDSTLFVTSAGSDKLITVDAKSGDSLGSVNIGSVPRGIALEPASDKTIAWVFNAVDNSVSIVDASDASNLLLVETVSLEDPTHPSVKRGRKIFNTATASTTGTFSCASCHPDGHTDQLLWVLKTPIVSGGNQIMPRSTMPIRGLRETAPFHWDGIPGDPYGGNNSANVHRQVAPNSDIADPVSTARHLIDGALGSTMAMVGQEGKNDEGKSGLLSSGQRNDLARFLLAVPYPPAQQRAYTNELTERAREGFELFHIKGDDDPSKTAPNVCGDCHRMPNWVSTNTPGSGMDAPTWRGAYDRWLILPQGRLNIVEFPFFRNVAERGLDEESIWRFSWGGRPRFNPVWNMVVEGSTGFTGTFARQTTLCQATVADNPTIQLLDAIETSALERACIVQVSATFIEDGQPVRKALQLIPDGRNREAKYVEVDQQFSRVSTARPGSESAPAYHRKELIRLAKDGKFVGTFTAHIGQNHDYDHPQPVIWTRGPIERQRGQQQFPFVHPNKRSMQVSGRHIASGAFPVVNGHRVDGAVYVENERVTIELAKLPESGMQLLQIQNPDGLISNDFIFHVADSHQAAEKVKQLIRDHRTDSRTAFVAAVSKGNLTEAGRLLKRGAIVNARDPESGSTALSAAALRGNLRMVRFLIKNGANVSRTNRDGNAPLHVAAFLGRMEIVGLLIENGASDSQKNRRQETPRDVVSGEWSEGLGEFYLGIAAASGFEIDLDQIKLDRKKMAQKLGEIARSNESD